MPKNRKAPQRSVAIQSTDLNVEETELQSNRLCKKAGFRNLLQQSVTVLHEDVDSENIMPVLVRQKSKCIQATPSTSQTFQDPEFRDIGTSMNLPLTDKINAEGDSSSSASELVTATERYGSSNPGTSTMASTNHSAVSIASPLNRRGAGTREGSVGVVFNYEDNNNMDTKSYSLPYIYGSQGSRRYSDETVILIEDYHSYDYTNAASRRSSSPHRFKTIKCCKRKKRSSLEAKTRPVPIDLEDIDEGDEEIVCRICHEGENVEQLIQPCLCKGTVGSVHAKCLKSWLEQSNTSRCELCNYPYAIRQTKKYPKCVSVNVFFQSVVDRRALAYDVISFVVITPLTLVGVVMCIQASIFSSSPESENDSNYQMGNITKAGMIMLSGTIVVAYGVWLYTLISYHFKSWKKWYNSCYDVEVLPVRMTSEERLLASRRFSEEIARRQVSREQGSTLLTVMQPPNTTNYSFYQRRFSVATVFQAER